MTLRRISFAQGHSELRQAQHGSEHGEQSRTKRVKRFEL